MNTGSCGFHHLLAPNFVLQVGGNIPCDRFKAGCFSGFSIGGCQSARGGQTNFSFFSIGYKAQFYNKTAHIAIFLLFSWALYYS